MAVLGQEGVGRLPGRVAAGVAFRGLRLLARWFFEVLDLAPRPGLAASGERGLPADALAAGFVREGLLRSYEEVKGERWDMTVSRCWQESWEPTRSHALEQKRDPTVLAPTVEDVSRTNSQIPAPLDESRAMRPRLLVFALRRFGFT